MILLFFVLCFVCLVCFFTVMEKEWNAVVDYDSFTLISVAVVHYNCVPSSSAPSLWKQILLFWEDTSLNFNIDIGHLFNIELLQQGEAGKHYLIILRTSERLLFPRHKRYFLGKKKGKVMRELSLSVMLWVPSLGGKGCLSSLEDSVFQVWVSDVSWVRTSRITTKVRLQKTSQLPPSPTPASISPDFCLWE